MFIVTVPQLYQLSLLDPASTMRWQHRMMGDSACGLLPCWTPHRRGDFQPPFPGGTNVRLLLICPAYNVGSIWTNHCHIWDGGLWINGSPITCISTRTVQKCYADCHHALVVDLSADNHRQPQCAEGRAVVFCENAIAKCEGLVVAYYFDLKAGILFE